MRSLYPVVAFTFFAAAAPLLVACGGTNTDAADDSDVDESASAASIRRYEALPALGTALEETTVSGLSSGAFMAVQMNVAHASIIKGAAVFAGGPYGCAGGSSLAATTTCMKGGVDPSLLADGASMAYRAAAFYGLAGSESELSKSRVYLFGGADDAVVNPTVMDATAAFYAKYVPAERTLRVDRRPATGHVFPTTAIGDNCKTPDATYVGRCGFDGAGEALAHLYGADKPLAPPSERSQGTLSRFSQRRYLSVPVAYSIADDGYVYVPKACVPGAQGHDDEARCRVHVAFHGCAQNAERIGETFVRNSGYARWADTNRIVVLFPQTTTTSSNPNACWDWWGYTGPAYANKLGPQIQMVRRMLDALARPAP